MKIIIICIAALFTSGCFIVSYPEMAQERNRLEREKTFTRGHYEDQIEQYKNQVVRLNSQLADVLAEKESERRRNEREIAALRENFELTQMEYDRTIEELKGDLQRYRGSYDELSHQLEGKEQQIARLNQQLQDKSHEIDVQKEKVAHYENELNKFQSGYDDIYGEFNKVVDDYEALVQENEDLADKVYALEQQIHQKEQEIRNIRASKEKEIQEIQASVENRTGPSFNLRSPAETIERAMRDISRDIEVSHTPYSIRLLIPGSKLFTVGTAQIESQSHSTLNRVASVLKSHENDYYFFVEGHTDALPLVNAPFPSNWELSAARATNLVRYLIQETQLNPESLVALACSSYRPVSEVLEKNRRIEIVLIPRELYVFN